MNFRFSFNRGARRKFESSNRDSRRFQPRAGLTALEPRQLLAAGPLGINLDSTLGYVDLIKETRPWTALNGSTLPLDANGWPQADAQILVRDDRVNQSFNGPDPNAAYIDLGGTYHLSFTGQATLTPDFPGNWKVQNQVYNAATNTTTADLVVIHNGLSMLYIDFSNTSNPASSTKAGVSNVTLIQPGYAADTTQLFSNTMLNDLAPFTTLRYLNIDGANNYNTPTDSNGKIIPLEWSQRKLPSASSQTSGQGAPGEAWEYMVALANATNTDMWINIPGPASNDYVTKLANLIKNGDTVNGVTYAGLKPGLKVNIELSNEVWGGIYSTYYFNQYAAAQRVAAGNSDLNNDGTTDPNAWAQRYYLERTMEVTNIFRSVYGADPTYSTIRPMLGWQESNVSYYTSNFPWFEKIYGAPRNFFYGMGHANYANPTDLSSVDSFFATLNVSVTPQYNITSQYATVANYYGLQTVAYEGGPDASARTAAQGQVALAANRDPRMQAFFQQLYTAWYTGGGGLAEIYDGPYSVYSPSYQYGLVEAGQASNPQSSPRYRAVTALSQSAPLTVTAGSLVNATSITTLPLTSDALGQSFAAPLAGQANKWLLNVSAAGSYNLTLQTTTSSVTGGQVTVSLLDGTTLGTYALGKGGTYSLGTLSLPAGLTTLQLTTVSPFTPLNLTLTPKNGVTASSGLGDTGFENVQLANATFGNAMLFGYQGNIQGSAWTFSGGSGLAANGSLVSGSNPNAPQGKQVAFLQAQGAMSQSFNNPTTGTFHLTFSVAQRATSGGGSAAYQVLIDDVVIGSFIANSTIYQAITTPSFVMTGGLHLLTFRGSTSGASTGLSTAALFDAIALVNGANTTAPVATTPTFADSSFETVSAGAGFYSFVYNPTGSAWTFANGAGLTGNGSAYTTNNPTAPSGQQVAFLQNQGTISQTLTNLAAGTYHITFAMAQRANWTNAPETFQLLADNTVVGTFVTSGAIYQANTTASFALTAGAHRFTFKGVASGTDATALLDLINLVPDTTTTPPTLTTTPTFADSSFETVSAGAGFYSFVYNPTGSAWTFANGAGLTGNGSAFTASNPTAPSGQQVAFLQNQGTISQTLTNLAAGTYHITFAMAQRANWTNAPETFQLLADNTVVGTFVTSGSRYQSITSASFALTAGAHQFTFKGVASRTDGTALLDGINLVPDTTTTTPTLTTTPTFADSSFETVSAGAGFYGFVYNPTGSAWTFANGAGLTGNGSAFTASNPTAPSGQQVAFLQNQGTISQTLTNLAAGTYHITFAMAQRANWTNAPETFQLLADNTVVGTFVTSGSRYQSITSASFALTAGAHQFTFKGVASRTDGTALLDGINLVPDTTTTTPTPTTTSTPTQSIDNGIGDAGFEAVPAGSGLMGFVVEPTGSAWTFNGGSAVSANGTAYTNGNSAAPQGKQVGVLTNQSVITQVFNNQTSGTYQLSFAVAQRTNYSNRPEGFMLLIDNQVVMTYMTTTGVYQTINTPSFVLTTGAHVISFKGFTYAGEASAFLDNVTLTQQNP